MRDERERADTIEKETSSCNVETLTMERFSLAVLSFTFFGVFLRLLGSRLFLSVLPSSVCAHEEREHINEGS